MGKFDMASFRNRRIHWPVQKGKSFATLFSGLLNTIAGGLFLGFDYCLVDRLGAVKARKVRDPHAIKDEEEGNQRCSE